MGTGKSQAPTSIVFHPTGDPWDPPNTTGDDFRGGKLKAGAGALTGVFFAGFFTVSEKKLQGQGTVP